MYAYLLIGTGSLGENRFGAEPPQSRPAPGIQPAWASRQRRLDLEGLCLEGEVDERGHTVGPQGIEQQDGQRDGCSLYHHR